MAGPPVEEGTMRMDRYGFERLLLHRMHRRRFFAGVTAAATGTSLRGRPTRISAEEGTPAAGSNLFTLGVASGDPLPDGVVLWTRLASDPLNGGGMGSKAVDVRWEVAGDEHFGKIVRKG